MAALRHTLLKSYINSVRLVKHLATRSFIIHGHSNNYSAYEIFKEALEEANKYCQKRLEALRDGIDLPWLLGIHI